MPPAHLDVTEQDEARSGPQLGPKARSPHSAPSQRHAPVATILFQIRAPSGPIRAVLRASPPQVCGPVFPTRLVEAKPPADFRETAPTPKLAVVVARLCTYDLRTSQCFSPVVRRESLRFPLGSGGYGYVFCSPPPARAGVERDAVLPRDIYAGPVPEGKSAKVAREAKLRQGLALVAVKAAPTWSP